jgi:hypothetical protein
MEQQIIESALNIITPVMESSIVLAGEYAKACGRDFITAMDVQYAMKYAARNVTGRYTGTLFPEIDSDEESDDDEEIEVIDEDDEAYRFTRYDGTEQQMLDMNEAFDTWEQWEPYSMVEKMLKDAVDKNS